jgi:sugar phosphate isomerase/epimerase
MASRLALSPVTVGATDFRFGVEVAAAAGYSGVAIRYDQLDRYLRAGHTVRDAAALLADNGLEVPEVGFLAEWQLHGGLPIISRRVREAADDNVARLRRDLDRFFATSKELGGQVVTAAATTDSVGSHASAVSAFKSLCAWAGRYDLSVAFEFFGQAQSYATLGAAMDLVAAAGAPNGGLLLDTFMFHQGESDLADIARLGGSRARLLSVQVADAAPGAPRSLDTLNGRRLPGEGVVPLPDILRQVAAIGYDGWYVVEVFNQAMSMPVAVDVARRVKETLSALVLGSAGS